MYNETAGLVNKPVMRLSRDIAAFIISIALFGLIPIYGSPFGGCVEFGFHTFAIGCSAWPEFTRGFIFIVTLAAISAHKKLFIAIGLTVVILVVMIGGVENIATGEAIAYFKTYYLDVAQHVQTPLLLGAFAALILYIAIIQIIKRGASNAESA